MSLLDKIDPYSAVFAAGCVFQWLAYRKDLAKQGECIVSLTNAVNKLTDRLGGGGK